MEAYYIRKFFKGKDMGNVGTPFNSKEKADAVCKQLNDSAKERGDIALIYSIKINNL